MTSFQLCNHHPNQAISSVAQCRTTLCDPTNHSTPGLPVHHQFPESTQTHVHQVIDAIQPTISSSAVPFSSCPQSFPVSRSFQRSQLFTSGGQSIGVLASTSVPPMNTQDCRTFSLPKKVPSFSFPTSFPAHNESNIDQLPVTD